MAVGTLITSALAEGVAQAILNGAKKIGLRAFKEWEDSKFPAKLARRINNIGKVKTLWSQDKELLINDFYFPPKIKIDGHIEKPIKISDLPEGPSIIEGIAGQGKSILLRYLAFSELKSNEGVLVPVFIELRSLTKIMGLRDAIYKILYSYDIQADEDSIEYILGSGKFALLLDGFDEVESQLVKDLLSDIEAIITRYPALRLLITTRPYDEIQKSTLLRKITIEPLKTGDYVEFLKAGGFSAASAVSIRDAIQKSSGEIANLITTPLMLTLVGQLYQNELEIPDNTPEFFERIFRHTFVTHDRLKAGIKRKKYTNLGDRKLQELFEAFCFICMCEGIVATVPGKEFGKIFDQAIEYTVGCDCDSDDFLQEITKGACLLLPDGDENIHFLHKSLLDYFSASFIKKAESDFSTKFYREISDCPEPWFQTLAFLQHIDSGNFYSKFYLPEINCIIDEQLNFIDSKDVDGFINFVERYHPDFGVVFRENGSNELITLAFGGFAKPGKFSLQKLNVSLTVASSKTIPDKVSKSFISEYSSVALQDIELGLHVKLRHIVQLWGHQIYFDYIDGFKNNLIKSRDEANKLIEVGARKASLLSRMKYKEMA